jgi:cytochrome c
VVFGEFTRNYLKEVRLDSSNNILKINSMLNCGDVGAGQPFECDNPMDLQFGADGNFYLLTYGDGFFAANPDAGLYRWSYVKGQRAPNAVLNTDRTDGAIPLTVQFSSTGTRDPDPGDALTYAWDFNGDGAVDSTDPAGSYTYTTAGVYVAKRTGTDSAGKTDIKTVTITAGNTSPTVTINTPVNGDFFDWGQSIPYTVTVTDPEDGPIDCNRVHVTFVLVHDEHGHAEQTQDGCSGVMTTLAEDANHGGSIAGAISASYTDLGANGQPALTSQDQNIVNMRRQQVEFVTEQSGTNTGNTNDPDNPGGLNRGSLNPGDFIALNRSYFLGNMQKLIRIRWAGGANDNTAGNPRMNVEIRTGSPTGDLLTTVTLNSTGNNNNTWTTAEFPLDFAGTQRLYLVFRAAPGVASPNGGLGNINWVEFAGPGATG